ncbi:MAG: hypothetical protein UY97_C0003G0065 [Parcubacteria group bacterium GW2011_GWB1_57_6]|nr:MAG: hypothetical protein UY93_C0002G0156 [Parcubacteria group bacterium GW2011_GWA1_56_13]KKW46791.1 MAG: hypothetical protein UY97_C0003G0065 [Parcubacteria group bacterium GW2011_GWB1_57_6]
MRKKLKVIAILATGMLLGACAGPGKVIRVPFNINGQNGTMVVHDQQVPNWMLDGDALAMNFFVKGEVTQNQLAAIAEGERVCRIYADATHPSNLVAVVSDGALYGVLGYIGAGIGAHAFPRAIPDEYAEYVGTVAAASGVGTGIRSIGSKKYSFENCSQNMMANFMSSVRVLRQ